MTRHRLKYVFDYSCTYLCVLKVGRNFCLCLLSTTKLCYPDVRLSFSTLKVSCFEENLCNKLRLIVNIQSLIGSDT